MYLLSLLRQIWTNLSSSHASMGPVSIGVEVQRNTDGDTPSRCNPNHLNTLNVYNHLYKLQNIYRREMRQKRCRYNLSCFMRKTCFLHKGKQGRDQLLGNSAANQCLCFHYIGSTIHLLPESEISSLWPSSGVVQSSLCRTW